MSLDSEITGRRKLGRGDQLLERQVDLYELTIKPLIGRLTELTELMRGNIQNHVLFSGTVLLDANGLGSRSFHSAMGSAMVANHSGADVVVVGASLGGEAPAAGPGVHLVPPGAVMVVNITGLEVALYGATGARVGLQVFTVPHDPMAGLVDVDAGDVPEVPAALANGVETAVGAAAVLVLGAGVDRRVVLLQNTGDADVRVGVAGVAANTGLLLAPGAVARFDRDGGATGAFFAIRDGATDSVVLAMGAT